jgi:hypothetical protein
LKINLKDVAIEEEVDLGLGSALARKISLARQARQACQGWQVWQVFGKASKFFSDRFISVENFFKYIF